MATLASPLIAGSLDPGGAFCDKAIEIVASKVPLVGERLAILAKSYGLYDTVRKGYEQRGEAKTFKDKVLEACHLE